MASHQIKSEIDTIFSTSEKLTEAGFYGYLMN